MIGGICRVRWYLGRAKQKKRARCNLAVQKKEEGQDAILPYGMKRAKCNFAVQRGRYDSD
jgi:hypothetical protein